MTIGLAETDGSELIFAADSAGTDGDEIHTIDTSKVFARDGYLFAYSGSYRIGQILRHCVELPEVPVAGDVERFLVREVGPAVRSAVEAEGAAAPGQKVLGEKTSILIGVRGQIWCMLPDLTVIPEGPFGAIGSGRLRAYAALHALRAAGFGPARHRIELALEATAAYTSSVRPPWQFVSSAGEEVSP